MGLIFNMPLVHIKMELTMYVAIFYETLEGGEWGKVPQMCKQGRGN